MTVQLQTLGAVTGLVPTSQTAFRYPEFAVLTSRLGDGVSEPNVVLQSAAPSIRRCSIAWAPLDDADVETIQVYAETKTGVSFIEEDGTSRTVVVMDFEASLIAAGAWQVQSTLLEVVGPAVESGS